MASIFAAALHSHSSSHHVSMSSSFRRRQRPGVASSVIGLSGTKPWTGGITLTSVGLRELDAILGGGQPLGTCILLEEDRWTRDLGTCLAKYWCAEVRNKWCLLLSLQMLCNICFTHHLYFFRRYLTVRLSSYQSLELMLIRNC
jgi:hypothetical protein